MKKTIFAVSLTLAVVFCASANEPYYPTKKGVALLTSIRTGNDDAIYARQVVSDVTGRGNNLTVSSVMHMLNAQKQPLPNTPPIPMTVRIVNGAVEMNMGNELLSSMTSAILAGAEPGMDVKMNVTGDTTFTLPARIAPGDKLNDMRMKMTMDMSMHGMAVTIEIDMAVTDIRCVAAERVTVPAGTFNSVKIVQTANATMSFLGQTLTMTSTSESWYARGIGTVKSVTQNRMAVPGATPETVTTTQLLQSIER